MLPSSLSFLTFLARLSGYRGRDSGSFSVKCSLKLESLVLALDLAMYKKYELSGCCFVSALGGLHSVLNRRMVEKMPIKIPGTSPRTKGEHSIVFLPCKHSEFESFVQHTNSVTLVNGIHRNSRSMWFNIPP